MSRKKKGMTKNKWMTILTFASRAGPRQEAGKFSLKLIFTSSLNTKTED